MGAQKRRHYSGMDDMLGIAKLQMTQQRFLGSLLPPARGVFDGGSAVIGNSFGRNAKELGINGKRLVLGGCRRGQEKNAVHRNSTFPGNSGIGARSDHL